jgi:nitroreductase
MTADLAQHRGGSCFLCGHCAAICPAGAIALSDRNDCLGLATIVEDLPAIAPGKADVSGLVAFLRSRRSCRQYLETPVPRTLLEDLAKIGTTAPSGTNSQAWEFTILSRREDVVAFGVLIGNYYRRLNRLAASPVLRLVMKVIGGDRLGRYYRAYFPRIETALREWEEQGIDRLFHGATAAILVGCRSEASCPAEDALLATGNILAVAHAMGLGSCLIGFAVEAMRRAPEIGRALAIPAGERVYSVIALGYPALTYARPAGRLPASIRHIALAGCVQ